GRQVRRAETSMRSAVDADGVMRDALDLTRSTYPHPNPRVAAIIIDPDGRRVASGVHMQAGQAHAERLALDGGRFEGHTMVVTLEPCNHTGATPPCTEAIIEAGITHVIVGAPDPDERVGGEGIARLQDAGVDVSVGTLVELVEANDPAYFHHRRTGRARMTLKLASTLDGQIAAADGTSQWITGPEAREDVHRLRAGHDAVLVGSGTARTDDPSLTVRLADWSGPQPRPVVVVGDRELPEGLAIAERDPVIYQSPDGVDLHHVAEDLPNHGILSVLVEGGPSIAASLLKADLIDEIVWYFGAKVAGGTGMPAFGDHFATLSDATEITVQEVARIGSDIRVVASVGRNSKE
ncbi:MAG: bifunctional diaminohydroxyphosphoribosylaminopyrimidine deaminase/5-amino-6-(5-phosphoribosylamino)uracil reductase RibD, partial [Acidimicrobiia bacterium]